MIPFYLPLFSLGSVQGWVAFFDGNFLVCTWISELLM